MQDHVIYRCVNAACARSMPRPVNFCPYCGTAQEAAVRGEEQGGRQTAEPVERQAGRQNENGAGHSANQQAGNPDGSRAENRAEQGSDNRTENQAESRADDRADDRAGNREREAAMAAAAGAAANAAASPSGWSDAPVTSASPAAASPAAQQAGSGQGARASGDATRPAPSPDAAAAHAGKGAPTPDAHRFGRSGGARPAAAVDAAQGGGPARNAGKDTVTGAGAGAAPQDVPRPPIPARPAPAQRRPVRLRWWLLALILLWGVWLWAKPSARKTEQRIDHAIALARECKGSAAQAELAALRTGRASPEQLTRLQSSLDNEAAVCTKRRQRNKAWTDASSAVEAALAAGSPDKARARLQVFTRRWGEDGRTRELKARIQARLDERGGANGGTSGDARGDAHPLAAPEQSGARAPRADAGRSGATLLAEARGDLAHGDYAGAADKTSLCLAMGDSHYRECLAVKAQAEREGMY